MEGLVVRTAEAAVTGLMDEAGTEATRALSRDRLYGVGRRATVDGVPSGTIESLGAEGELSVNTRDRGDRR